MSLNEAYFLSNTFYDNTLCIGASKFCMLWPKHALLASQKHQEVCYCIYHKNIELLLHGFQSKPCIQQVPGVKELCNLTLCEESKRTELCIDRQCSKCGVDEIEKHFNHFDFDDCVSYYQWINLEGNTKKISVTSSVAEGIETLKLLFTPFAHHVFNVKM